MPKIDAIEARPVEKVEEVKPVVSEKAVSVPHPGLEIVFPTVKSLKLTFPTQAKRDAAFKSLQKTVANVRQAARVECNEGHFLICAPLYVVEVN